MKLIVLAAGLMTAAILPTSVLAQVDPACQRSNQNTNTEGTLLGAAGGALAGSVLAGRHDRGLGAVLGGVGGAVIGNRLANTHNDPCPEGYYRNPNYGPAYAPQPAYSSQGAYNAPRRDYGPQSESYGYGQDFWRGSPEGASERVQWLQQRIDRGRQDGSLSPSDARRAERELNQTMQYMRTSRRRYGELRPQDRQYVQARLDHVSRTIRWARHNGPE